jgi:hypothetical protein
MEEVEEKIIGIIMGMSGGWYEITGWYRIAA